MSRPVAGFRRDDLALAGRAARHNGRVTVTAPAPRAFRPGRALTYLGGVGLTGLALSAVYATTGLGVPCPFRLITGWDCPLCGGTRMGSALLHGDLSAAFWFNPVALVGLVVVTVLGVIWTIEALGGPSVRLPRSMSDRLRAVPALVWLVLGLALAAAYVLVRNLI